MRHPLPASLCLVCLLSFPGGCRKETAPLPPPAHPGGTLRAGDVLAAWRSAGLAPEGFATMTPSPYGAAYCERGLVHGLDTILCEFEREETLKSAVKLVKQQWATFEVSTALAVPNRRTVLFVADRGRREPSGRSMGQMAKIFTSL